MDGAHSVDCGDRTVWVHRVGKDDPAQERLGLMWNLKTIALIATFTLLVGCAVYAYNSVRQSGMQEVQTLWDLEKLAVAQAQAEQEMKARQKEQALQALIDKQRKEHRNEVNRIVREYAVLTDSLRNRPERPSDAGLPESPDARTEHPTGCTGAQLYRGDSEFLAREAHRADQLRIALQACTSAYDQVRRQVNGEQE
jgi:hypothetical protein